MGREWRMPEKKLHDMVRLLQKSEPDVNPRKEVSMHDKAVVSSEDHIDQAASGRGWHTEWSKQC